MNENKCIKCGHASDKNKEKFGLLLCNICYTFAPNTPEELDIYVEEKIPSKSIDLFRKYASFRGENQKLGMIKKSSIGKHMSRIPFGYEWDFREKNLIPAKNSREVEEIFEGFLEPGMNLSTLSKKHKFSVNGLKKILRNFAYLGKVKFDGQIHDGRHTALVSSILFNKVQDKLDRVKNQK